MARKGDLDALGVSLSCTVKEDLKEGEEASEIEAFRAYWPSAPIYLDEEMNFYRAVGGGEKTQSSLATFLLKLMNPWSQVKKNMKRAEGVDGNLKGEGFIHGGVYVVKKGALKGEEPVYAHHEAEIGDHPPTDDLVEACKRAADASK
mmetsp:Transcript_21972/g.70778  ORF Transcript_21972/g.70778 Transcript_21972/m.70778 type:complete len:147 (+) Transcript_21972:211-651(+)